MTNAIERKVISAACRLPPNAIALQVADSGAKVDDFAEVINGEVWKLVMGLALKGKRVTDIELMESAAASQIIRASGGPAAVLDILRTPPELPFADLLERLREQGKMRRATNRLTSVLDSLRAPGAKSTSVREGMMAALKDMAEDAGGVRTSEGLCAEIINDLEAVSQGRKEPIIRTGLEAWDGVLGGLQPNLIAIGAMPGVGKSALLTGIVRNLAEAGVKVGFFSLEDEKRWIANRLFSYFSRVPLQTMLYRPIEPYQMGAAQDAMSKVYDIMSKVVIDDRQGIECRDVVAMADAMVADGCRVIIVDHLGEIRIKSRERHDLEITEVCSDLRGIAKRHGVPVVLACHLKRNGNEDEQSVPRLTDFAFSAGIERTCRVGLGLSRVWDDKAKAVTPDLMRVHVLKQTNGVSKGTFDLEIDGRSAVVKNTPAPTVEADVVSRYEAGAWR